MRTLASIIKEVEEAKTPKEQAKILKENSSAGLKAIIGYALDPGVTWLVPPSDPPYRPLPKSADQEGRLYAEARKFIYFVNSTEGRNITPHKREQLFIQVLESIDPDDAILMLRVKNKALDISPKAAKIAFPNLTANWP